VPKKRAVATQEAATALSWERVVRYDDLHQGVDIALSPSLLEAVFGPSCATRSPLPLSADKSCSEKSPHFALIYARTICLVSAAVSDFAAVALEATFVM
jgi:hypothetical protein